MNFTSFAVATLAHDMPAQAAAGDEVEFTITAEDAQAQALAGFNASAVLTSDPAGMQVLQQPVFADGTAQARVRFPAEGSYVVNIAGLAPPSTATWL